MAFPWMRSWSLRKRILVLLCVLLSAVGYGGHLATGALMARSAEVFEEHNAAERFARVLVGVSQSISAFEASIVDYATWDATYFHLLHHDAKYLESNYTASSMQNFGFEEAIFLTVDSRLHSAVQLHGDGVRPLEPDSSLVQKVRSSLKALPESVRIKGGNLLRWVDGVPVVMVFSAVRRSDGDPAVAGWMVMVRDLQRASASLAQLTGSPLTFSENAVGTSTTKAQHSMLLQDSSDASSMHLVVSLPPVLNDQRNFSQQLLLLNSVAMVVIAIIAVSVLLNGLVLRRLSQFSELAGAPRSNDRAQTTLWPVRGTDELDRLAIALNGLVEDLRSSERVLEERVEQRTAALFDSKTTLELTLSNLRSAQAQLIQSEKMASIGQLVSSVAHEINTPIAVVKSSGKNIAEALDQIRDSQERFGEIDLQSRQLFYKLIGHAKARGSILSTREERILIRDATEQLDAAGIDEARDKASLIVQLNAQSALRDYLPLLRHPECELILSSARSNAVIINSTDDINVAVDRVSKIVFALKSFSRNDASAEMVAASIQVGLNTVLTLYQNQMKHGVELIQNYEDIPLVRCLPDELNQVWTNLIHNALQAMNYEGSLTVGVCRVDDEAVISIGDSGPGIDLSIREKIFDPFFTTKPTGEGSGLGLDIVKKIIEKHQGRIDFQSEVGQGTTFSVYLPLASGEHG